MRPTTTLVEATVYLGGLDVPATVHVTDTPPAIMVSMSGLGIVLADRPAAYCAARAWRDAAGQVRVAGIPQRVDLPAPRSRTMLMITLTGGYGTPITLTRAPSGAALKFPLGGLTVILCDAAVIAALAGTWARVDRLAAALWPDQDIPTRSELPTSHPARART